MHTFLSLCLWVCAWKCTIAQETCIWIEQSNSLKVWTNIHHVNQADLFNVLAQSHSNKIVYLGSQLQANRKRKHAKHLIGTNQLKPWSHWKVKWITFIVFDVTLTHTTYLNIVALLSTYSLIAVACFSRIIHHINMLTWPPNSLELSPIEHLWNVRLFHGCPTMQLTGL